MKLLPIDRITIGERSRQELANIDSLARSIKERGLLQPPVVRYADTEIRLVCGERRIEACKSLGWTTIPVHAIESEMDELAALYAEGDENTEREPFTVAEAVQHRRRIRDAEARAAKERQREHGGTAPGKSADTSTNLEEVSPRHERETRHRTAKATGYGASTLDKAEQIVSAAEDESQPEPVRETAREAAEELGKSGAKVNREYKRVKQAMDESLAGDADYQAATYRKNLSKDLAAVQAVSQHDPERVIEVADELTFEVIDNAIQSINEWHERISKMRSRPLRVVNGGKL